jgi:hypothetical protein
MKMDLIKAQKINFPVTASPEHRQVIIAAKQPALKNYTKAEVLIAVGLQVDRAKKLTGQKEADEGVIMETVSTIAKKISSGKFGSLTAAQLELSIERGATGEYGDFFGVNALTINNWINKFYAKQLEHRKKQIAHETKLKGELEQQKQTEYYKENSETLLLGRLRIEYENLLANGKYIIQDQNNYFYLYLQKIGKLPEINPRRDEFIKAGQARLRELWRLELLNTKGGKRTIIKGWLQNTSESIEGKPKMKEKLFIVVQELILIDYLNSCKELNFEFNEII